MKLIIPEPEIDLYKVGFSGNDLLGRRATGERLSELVEKIDDPIVIALDGVWGSGKSHFLKLWVGAHTLENKGTAKTVYFDAFEHDFLDDPLIALTGVIGDRFEGKAGKRWDKAKSYAAVIGRGALRAGLAIGTYGATEAAGAAVDAAIVAGGKELEKATEAFWKREDGKRAAMAAFREALGGMTEPEEDGGKPQKIVIVIDELDRCRPDYALSLLEVIKHFFSVPNVHFVLGVNLNELQNSVRARYGVGVDAGKYLQKFIHIRMPLRSSTSIKGTVSDYCKYFERLTVERDMHGWWISEMIRDYLLMTNHHDVITLRDIQKIVTLAVITPSIGIENEVERNLFAGLLVFQIIKPDWVELARRGKLSFEQVESFFKLNRLKSDGVRFEMAFWAWKAALTEGVNVADIPKVLGAAFGKEAKSADISAIIANCLDSVDLVWE